MFFLSIAGNIFTKNKAKSAKLLSQQQLLMKMNIRWKYTKEKFVWKSLCSVIWLVMGDCPMVQSPLENVIGEWLKSWF